VQYGVVYVLLAGILWGMIGPAAKIAMDEGLSAMDTAWWRTLFAWFLFAGQWLLQGRPTPVQKKDIPAVLGFGVLGVAGLHGFYVLAVREGGAATAAILLYTAPAWVAILSRLVLGEVMTPAKLLAVALTLAGVTLVGLSGSGEGIDINAAGIAFGIASALSYALYYVFGKRFEGRYSTSSMFIYTLPAALLALSPGCEFTMPSATALACGAWLGLMCTFGAVTVYYMGLKRMEATRAAVLCSIEPLTAALLAYIMFGEMLGLGGFLGAAMILSATFVVVRDGARRQRMQA
jgi:DME family drug/metabolite transporter